MQDIQIQLSALWTALMMIYFLGDVLRIFSGDYKKMSKEMKGMNNNLWMIAAVMMLVPISMIVLTLFLPYEVNRWANMIAAGVMFLFNIVGIPGYPSFYDKFLLSVSLIFNLVTIWVAWSW